MSQKLLAQHTLALAHHTSCCCSKYTGSSSTPISCDNCCVSTLCARHKGSLHNRTWTMDQSRISLIGRLNMHLNNYSTFHSTFKQREHFKVEHNNGKVKSHSCQMWASSCCVFKYSDESQFATLFKYSKLKTLDFYAEQNWSFFPPEQGGACVDWLQKWLHEPWLSVAVWPRGLGSDKHTNKEETWAEERERPSQGLQDVRHFTLKMNREHNLILLIRTSGDMGMLWQK